MGNCIVLYSIGCPKCKVLEDKLNRKKEELGYNTINQ